MKETIKLILLCCLFISPFNKSSAQAISQLKKYIRCYSHLVNKRPPPADGLLVQVKAGSLTGQEACRRLLFNQTGLDANGNLLNPNPNGKSILTNMHRLHASWFNGKDLNVATEDELWNQEIYDYNSVGIYFTRALFDPSYAFSNVVTDNSSMDIRRDTTSPGGSSSVNDKVEGTDHSIHSSGPGGVTVGDIINSPWEHIENLGSGNSFNSIITGSRIEKGPIIGWKSLRPNSVDTHEVSQSVNYLNNTYGAGAMSTPAYLLGNTERYERSDGGQLSYRRWANRLVKDFLCRELPVISSNQAAPFVDLTSNLAFRKSRSCMGCHATQDNLSYMIRDFTQYRVGKRDTNFHYPYFDIAGRYPTSEAPENPLGFNTPDNNFYKRPAKGKFVFVNMEGVYIEQGFNSLDSFGDYMANFPDFYRCFAGRYLEYFTGIKPFLGNTQGTFLNQKELEQRNFAIELGSILQSSQDPREVIKRIFESPYYNDLYYGAQ